MLCSSLIAKLCLSSTAYIPGLFAGILGHGVWESVSARFNLGIRALRQTLVAIIPGDRSTPASSHDFLPAIKAITTPAKGEGDPEAIQMDEDAAIAQQTATQTSNDTNAPISTPAKTVSIEPAGPTANLYAFPVFATPATIKHTARPPTAPKLKIPVDLSKFVKKPAAKTPAFKQKADSVSSQATKNSPTLTIIPSSDIRTKRREERALFLNGPKVQVKLGDNILATLPKYILMQTSHKAFKHFTDRPDATTFVLPAGSMDEIAAKTHLDWMKEMTYQGRVYFVTLHSDEKFDDKNLQICRAARVLGINNMYIGHFTKIFCDRIRSNTASYEFLNKIAALACPGNDPLYNCLANNLADHRVRKAIKNSPELEALLQKYTGLQNRVQKIEERMRKKQEGAKTPKGSKAVHLARISGNVDVRYVMSA
ncbi:hypothetical protein E8E12_007294 [Didymella heteroderae]|uniref:Uncharacterized protein n=1 Tax=Didymella heteroderae TaxID=1769908 RepID=A0A9P4WSM2_9PLEO|nr:hypothetical protein E8E12_007294 [Didymella heteroderae]